MITGTLKRLTAGSGFTVNQEYSILDLAADNSAGGTVYALVVDDNGQIVATTDIYGPSWQVVTIYAASKVV